MDFKESTRIFWIGEAEGLRSLTAEQLLQEFEAAHLNADTLVRIQKDAQPRPLRRYLRELVWIAHEAHSETSEDTSADRSMFEAAFAGAPIGVVLSDLAGRLVHSNDAFCTLLGYSRDEVIGRRVSQLSEPGDREAELVLGNELLAGKRNSYQIEKRFRTRTGEILDTYTAISVVRDESGVPVHVIAHVIDLTPLKKLEKSRQIAEAENRAKSAFLSSMSHEIRTPMNAILGYAQILYREDGLSDRQREYLATIDRSGKHLLALINGVLDMAKIEAGQDLPVITDVNLYRLLSDVERMFILPTSKKGLHFAVRFDGTLPASIRTDAGKLRQILINLIGNSIKFTEQGHIDTHVFIESHSGVKRLIAEVNDTGCGMDASQVEHVFGAFKQAGTENLRLGTGLGLAVSREYARALGGELTAKSELGKGSVFRLEILFEEADIQAQVPAHRSIASIEALRPIPRIMVVDDVVENRVMLNNILQSVGVHTHTCASGQEALQAIGQDRPDLLLLDLRMPQMDGLEVIKRLRAMKNGEDLPIVIVSASVLDTERVEAKRAGANDFIAKPILEEDLFSVIVRLLSAKSARRTSGVIQQADNRPTGQVQTLVADVPTVLLVALREAACVGEMIVVEELLEELQGIAPALAEKMLTLSVNFEYGQLVELLDEHIALGR